MGKVEKDDWEVKEPETLLAQAVKARYSVMTYFCRTVVRRGL